MKYTVELTPDDMIYLPSFMKINSRIKVILRSLPRQSEIGCRVGKDIDEMTSYGVTHTY
jgi:hypothetical protein